MENAAMPSNTTDAEEVDHLQEPRQPPVSQPPTAAPTNDEAASESQATPPYLSLISAVTNYNNPNPLDSYHRDPRAQDGKGAWIVILDTGFELDKYPHELSSTDTSRTIQTYVPPPEIRYSEPMLRRADYRLDLEGAQDFGKPEEDTGIPKGHGTAVAIIAAGTQSGVAPKANLYLIKEAATVWDAEMGALKIHTTLPGAILHSLKHVANKIDEGMLPIGKTVLCLSFGYPTWDLERCFPGQVQWYKDQFAEALKSLSNRGVIVLLATPIRFFIPGHEEGSIGETVPHCLLTPDSDITVVGATDQQGRLWWYSIPGTQNCPVSVYAQGYDTQAYVLHLDKPGRREGTCFATPQVAGLAAYFLSHPDYQDYFEYSESDKEMGNTVGKRMKKC